MLKRIYRPRSRHRSPAARRSPSASYVRDRHRLPVAARSAPRCSRSASQTSCGNGVVDAGEVCDDGNIIDGDGCSHDCQSRRRAATASSIRGERAATTATPTARRWLLADLQAVEICGNGVDATAGEVCDDGNNSRRRRLLGELQVDRDLRQRHRRQRGGEVCDDGNTTGGDDDCSATAGRGEGCGNGIVDPGRGVRRRQQRTATTTAATTARSTSAATASSTPTACDDRAMRRRPARPRATSTARAARAATARSTATHRAGATGPEQCDDGDDESRRRTTAPTMCQLNVCGDGKPTRRAGMRGSATTATGPATTAARTNCTLPSCGNGVVDRRRAVRRRQHDQRRRCATTTARSRRAATASSTRRRAVRRRNATNGDAVRPRLHDPACGDGIIEPRRGVRRRQHDEQRRLRYRLPVPSCGDGIIDTGEQCDDGNTTNGDGCDSNCTLAVLRQRSTRRPARPATTATPSTATAARRLQARRSAATAIVDPARSATTATRTTATAASTTAPARRVRQRRRSMAPSDATCDDGNTHHDVLRTAWRVHNVPTTCPDASGTTSCAVIIRRCGTYVRRRQPMRQTTCDVQDTRASGCTCSAACGQRPHRARGVRRRRGHARRAVRRCLQRRDGVRVRLTSCTTCSSTCS